MNINRYWTTEHDSGTCTISFESLIDEKAPWNKLMVNVDSFPDKPTLEKPKRQVVLLSLFDDEDLWKLKKVIDMQLGVI